MFHVRTRAALFGWVVVLLPVAGWTEINERIAAAARALEGQVTSWRRDIHQHPELSNREFRTAALVADHLRRLGHRGQHRRSPHRRGRRAAGR
jgi:hypothetical protein